MKRKTLPHLIFSLLIVAALAACSRGTTSSPTAAPTSPPAIDTLPPATDTATAEPTAEPSATQAAQGACANPLFPVVKGATWTYSGSGGPSGAYSYTDTITDVRSDGFSISSKFSDNLTRTQEWACKPEGLVALQLPGAAATLTTEKFKANFETSNIQGVTIPARVSPGDKWSFNLDIKGKLDISGVTADTTGTASYNFTAANTESVTVPAGTFDAMKIDGVLTLDITASVSGLSVPLKITMNSTSWFAPGVGMVKTLSSGDLAGTPMNDTLELQSYNIP
ncbi:MAG: hypothetical protein ACM3QS_00300 [Bacteroidota bacterium]